MSRVQSACARSYRMFLTVRQKARVYHNGAVLVERTSDDRAVKHLQEADKHDQ